jgi:hypothetical protein
MRLRTVSGIILVRTDTSLAAPSEVCTDTALPVGAPRKPKQRRWATAWVANHNTHH